MRLLKREGVLSLAVGVVASGAFAFTVEQNIYLPMSQRTAYARVEQRVVRPSLESVAQNYPHIVNGFLKTLAQKDRLTGASRIMKFSASGPRSVGHKISHETIRYMAMAFIEENAEMFNQSQNEYRIQEDSMLIAPDIQSLTMQVYRDGLEVVDASVVFHFKNGEIIQVVNNSFSEVSGGLADHYDLEKYRRFAQSVLYARRTTYVGDVYRVRESGHSGYELVQVAEFEADVQGVPYRIQLEAESGDIYEIISTHIHANALAQATLYDRWYNDALTFKPLKELQIAKDVYTDNAGSFGVSTDPEKINLLGKRVEVKDKGKKPINLADNKRDDGVLAYFFERDPNNKTSKKLEDDRLTSQVMIYYHVTEMVQFAEKYIPETKWLQKPLPAYANVGGFLGLMSCNAYWNGKSINFYKGSRTCANTGLIADVVYHEWGHGLDANTGGIKDRAFSEGYGDIVAMLMTGSSDLGIGFKLPNHEPVRELETNKVYPKDRGEVHSEGLIIASTMWDVYSGLRAKYTPEQAKDIMANYVFKMIYTAARYTEVYDALLAIDDDDSDLSNGTPNYCLLNKAFTDHGLAKQDSKICR